jgi:titin
VLQGNKIGTDAAGTAKLPNHLIGVVIRGAATATSVGGTSPGAGNVISGNDDNGVEIFGPGTDGNLVDGNVIGTDLTGSASLGGALYGVLVWDGAKYDSIGGVVPGAGNTIAFNPTGVRVDGSTTTGDPIELNSIFADTTTVGITLTSGGDGSARVPTITSVTQSGGQTTISGTSRGGTDRVEVFADPSCSDPEGKTFLGVAAPASGSWSLSVPAIASGLGVTATATDTSTSNTSPFSACKSS